MSTVTSSLEVPIFYPSYEEFQDFSSYISKIESLDAHRIGLAKIIPPKQWSARRSGYNEKIIQETLVENPIKQEIQGKHGIYSVYNIQQRSLKLNEFQRLASNHRYASPISLASQFEKLEMKYWQNLTTLSPIYGADVSGSFYDENQTVWNVNRLGTILDDLQTECGTKIEGVNTAYLYFGMWKATFAWHTEDMDLYSINYLHFGAPKQWYVIPPSCGKRFEKLASSFFPSMARRCPGFLRHKMTVIAPSVLAQHSIPFSKMTQYQGEFIITFPYAYHAGFNYGFNCAESTNFALQRWIEYGKHSVQCACRHDMVKIRMDRFISKYQPDLYEDWCQGINRTSHPEICSTEPSIVSESSCDETRSSLKTSSFQRALSTNSSQLKHQQHITKQRYACIFRNLIKFDKDQQTLSDEIQHPLIRAALYRGRFKLKSSSNKLLRLSAISLLEQSSLPMVRSLIGIQQAGDYRKSILQGLWNFENGDQTAEIYFNQWISTTISCCAVCYLFVANQPVDIFYQSIYSILFEQSRRQKTFISNDFLTCSSCKVCVHRQCYETMCLALNVFILEPNNVWLCQRCQLSSQLLPTVLDDRCSACSLRGGLVLRSRSSTSFIHAVCSIWQAYQAGSKFQLIKATHYSCYYCWSFCPIHYRRRCSQSIISCHQPRCSNVFHLTCGLLNGCTVQFIAQSTSIRAYCHLHPKSKKHQTKAVIPRDTIIDNEQKQQYVDDYQIGDDNDDDVDDDDDDNDDDNDENDDEIVAEQKRIPNGSQVILNDGLIGRVINNEVSFHYAVDFGNGSYSYDMLAEDILHDHDLSALRIGTSIRIKWTDGTIYPCKYLGRKRVLLYQIELDQEIRPMQRHEFTCDLRPLSPPYTPNHPELDKTYNRRQPISKGKKRKKRRKSSKTRRLHTEWISSSTSLSSLSLSNDES